jgi:hypothetical protein
VHVYRRAFLIILGLFVVQMLSAAMSHVQTLMTTSDQVASVADGMAPVGSAGTATDAAVTKAAAGEVAAATDGAAGNAAAGDAVAGDGAAAAVGASGTGASTAAAPAAAGMDPTAIAAASAAAAKAAMDAAISAAISAGIKADFGTAAATTSTGSGRRAAAAKPKTAASGTSTAVYSSKQRLSDPFTVDKAGAVEIEVDAPLDNHWIDVGMTLVENSSGKSYDVMESLEYYSGTDSDGAWSEGERSGSASVASVPAGTYRLAYDAQSDAPGQSFTVHVTRGVVHWGNFWLLALLTLAFPAAATVSASRMESKRWAMSDFAPQSFGGGSGGKDD